MFCKAFKNTTHTLSPNRETGKANSVPEHGVFTCSLCISCQIAVSRIIMELYISTNQIRFLYSLMPTIFLKTAIVFLKSRLILGFKSPKKYS
jgi:hypothetical protein